MRHQRAQSSMEYLFVVVLSLTLILPASFLFFDFSKNSEDSVVNAQVNRVGQEIIAKAEQVYVIGNNSRVTLDLAMPDTLVSAMIYDEQELVLSYYTQSGLMQAVFFSDLPLMNGTNRCYAGTPCTLDFTPGSNKVRVLSKGDVISVSRE